MTRRQYSHCNLQAAIVSSAHAQGRWHHGQIVRHSQVPSGCAAPDLARWEAQRLEQVISVLQSPRIHSGVTHSHRTSKSYRKTGYGQVPREWHRPWETKISVKSVSLPCVLDDGKTLSRGGQVGELRV